MEILSDFLGRHLLVVYFDPKFWKHIFLFEIHFIFI